MKVTLFSRRALFSKSLFYRTSDCENNFDENFDVENLSGSLEDLVGTFDQKISQCFKDLNEATEDLAPVQVRSQDEIMSESQFALFFHPFINSALIAFSYSTRNPLPSLSMWPQVIAFLPAAATH